MFGRWGEVKSTRLAKEYEKKITYLIISAKAPWAFVLVSFVHNLHMLNNFSSLKMKMCSPTSTHISNSSPRFRPIQPPSLSQFNRWYSSHGIFFSFHSAVLSLVCRAVLAFIHNRREKGSDLWCWIFCETVKWGGRLNGAELMECEMAKAATAAATINEKWEASRSERERERKKEKRAKFAEAKNVCITPTLCTQRI